MKYSTLIAASEAFLKLSAGRDAELDGLLKNALSTFSGDTYQVFLDLFEEEGHTKQVQFLRKEKKLYWILGGLSKSFGHIITQEPRGPGYVEFKGPFPFSIILNSKGKEITIKDTQKAVSVGPLGEGPVIFSSPLKFEDLNIYQMSMDARKGISTIYIHSNSIMLQILPGDPPHEELSILFNDLMVTANKTINKLKSTVIT